MNNKINTRTIAGMGILTALVIALAFFSNYISFGSVNINLALVPIVVGACLYGPWWGAFLGAIDGIVIMVAPSTLAYFMPLNAVATVFLCILKTGIAGLVSGLIYKLLKNKNDLVAVILASIVVPLINTGIFILGAYLFFNDIYGGFMNIVVAVLTINFIIEFVVNAILSPSVYKIIKYALKNSNNKMAK